MTSQADLLYFGEPASFSHLAAQKRFPKYKLASCASVAEAFSKLVAGKVANILVPIENASSGMITDTVDQLIALSHATKASAKKKAQDLSIREALVMKVELSLLASASTKRIEKIYSHPAPFHHSQAWLQKNYPNAQQIAVASTSEAAQKAKSNPGAAAIAGKHAARFYGLKVVAPRVEGSVPNQTTFFVVGRPLRNSPKPTHTSLIFELPHRPGTLVEVLAAVARQKLNLTRIQSRPIPGRFDEYRFFIEFLASPRKCAGSDALTKIRSIAESCAVLGSYPVVKI